MIYAVAAIIAGFFLLDKYMKPSPAPQSKALSPVAALQAQRAAVGVTSANVGTADTPQPPRPSAAILAQSPAPINSIYWLRPPDPADPATAPLIPLPVPGLQAPLNPGVLVSDPAFTVPRVSVAGSSGVMAASLMVPPVTDNLEPLNDLELGQQKPRIIGSL